MNQNMLLFIQIHRLPMSMQDKWKKNIDFVCETTHGNHWGPTNSPQISPFELIG